MNVTKLRQVNGEGFDSDIWVTNSEKRKVFYIGDGDIDSDGGENVDHDTDWQPETALKLHGKSIDAQTVPGVVVPEWLPQVVSEIVLGSLAKITNLATGEFVWCVVHDLGPKNKDGEMTSFAAKKISVNPNSVSGGEDNPILLYEIWIGQAALVDGIQYDLQHAG